MSAHQRYPKQKCINDDDEQLTVPFSLVPGEYLQFCGRSADGIVALSNYRVFIQQNDTSYTIPLGVIDTLECREIIYLYILCKDSKTYK